MHMANNRGPKSAIKLKTYLNLLGLDSVEPPNSSRSHHHGALAFHGSLPTNQLQFSRSFNLSKWCVVVVIVTRELESTSYISLGMALTPIKSWRCAWLNGFAGGFVDGPAWSAVNFHHQWMLRALRKLPQNIWCSMTHLVLIANFFPTVQVLRIWDGSFMFCFCFFFAIEIGKNRNKNKKE